MIVDLQPGQLTPDVVMGTKQHVIYFSKETGIRESLIMCGRVPRERAVTALASILRDEPYAGPLPNPAEHRN